MIKADRRSIMNEMIELGEEDLSVVISRFKKDNNLIFSEMLIKDIHDLYVKEKKEREENDYIRYCSRLDR